MYLINTFNVALMIADIVTDILSKITLKKESNTADYYKSWEAAEVTDKLYYAALVVFCISGLLTATISIVVALTTNEFCVTKLQCLGVDILCLIRCGPMVLMAPTYSTLMKKKSFKSYIKNLWWSVF